MTASGGVDENWRHELEIRTTPAIAKRTATDIRDTTATMVRLREDDDLPIGEPCKNHDAWVANVSHHRKVAMVTAPIEPATTKAKHASMRRTACDRVSRRATAAAVTVHDANVAATSNANATKAQE